MLTGPFCYCIRVPVPLSGSNILWWAYFDDRQNRLRIVVGKFVILGTGILTGSLSRFEWSVPSGSAGLRHGDAQRRGRGGLSSGSLRFLPEQAQSFSWSYVLVWVSHSGCSAHTVALAFQDTRLQLGRIPESALLAGVCHQAPHSPPPFDCSHACGLCPRSRLW